MHGEFVKEMLEEVDNDKTSSWQWLSKCDLKIGTEALLCAAQEQTIRTNYVKYHIDKTSEHPLCRLCGKKVKVCLPLMWKLLTAILGEDLHGHLEKKSLLPDEQKGCRSTSRGTKDQLLIDTTIIRNCKRR